MGLQAQIEELWDEGRVEESPIVETIDLLDRGELRVAEPGPDGWVVNEWAKKAILLYFRLRKVEPMDVGGLRYLDKIPVKRVDPALGVRVVPPGVARYGAFLGEGVVLMPGYVNIGAWVGPRTMVDTWATVGSCAQIGADVHLAGGVGIGGVLEPPQAAPVIVEDGAFVGSRAVIVEGVRVGAGAVIGPNVVLSASVPIIDVTGPEPVEHRGVVPPRKVVLPGVRQKEYPGRHVRAPVRAHRRRAKRVDRPQDVLERRSARVRDRRLERGRSHADLLGRACQHDRRPRDRNQELSAGHRHANGAVAPASGDRGGPDGNRRRSGRARLACPSLPDEHADHAPRVGARQLHVRPPGEPRVHLERRTDPKEVVPRQHVATHHRMRVADVDRNERDPLTRQVERFVLPNHRLADLLADEPSGSRGTDAPTRRLHLDHLRPPSRRSHAAAIRVPFPDISALEPSGFQIAISARALAVRQHLDDAVAADSRARIA